MTTAKKGYIQKFTSWYFSREALPFWAISVLDIFIIFVSLSLMYALVYGPAKLVSNGATVLYTLIMDLVFYGIGMRVFHTYADVSKILEFKDLSRTAFSTLLGSVLCMAFRWAVDLCPFTTQIPYRVFVLTFFSATAVLWLWRIVARNFSDLIRDNVREEVELLPRQEIEVNMEKIGGLLRGKCVLITGAAGSIGSEMVRQIASYSPKRLILIDQAETPMHDVMLDVQKTWSYLDVLFIVSSITNKELMERIFATHKPNYVFHAAAYKHVPMMEENPSVSIQNNVVGTRILADLSVKYGVTKFVMISTDKAVNPTNVMGCSKRLCEIYVQSLNAHLLKASNTAETKTQFVTTRFGNVLGSNGSVIPLFKKQIEEGGPVTVTHPDIIRFFMLIPEACALVLEAGTMGNGGEIFVFDMGQPVKIADLARKMIQNSGRRDVKIKYTGLRGGEKLYEEVLFKGEEEVPTVHPKIHVAKVRQYEYEDVCTQLDELEELARGGDDMQIVRKMKMIVPEFKSNNSKYESLDRELANGKNE
ncbi:MAG: polysaccharide biosynthesis protein [Bacteroidaceae bacterium]|nr:polysaccharide biosynthesis protein [Bacteroidaceae bacterium]